MEVGSGRISFIVEISRGHSSR